MFKNELKSDNYKEISKLISSFQRASETVDRDDVASKILDYFSVKGWDFVYKYALYINKVNDKSMASVIIDIAKKRGETVPTDKVKLKTFVNEKIQEVVSSQKGSLVEWLDYLYSQYRHEPSFVVSIVLGLIRSTNIGIPTLKNIGLNSYKSFLYKKREATTIAPFIQLDRLALSNLYQLVFETHLYNDLQSLNESMVWENEILPNIVDFIDDEFFNESNPGDQIQVNNKEEVLVQRKLKEGDLIFVYGLCLGIELNKPFIESEPELDWVVVTLDDKLLVDLSTDYKVFTLEDFVYAINIYGRSGYRHLSDGNEKFVASGGLCIGNLSTAKSRLEKSAKSKFIVYAHVGKTKVDSNGKKLDVKDDFVMQRPEIIIEIQEVKNESGEVTQECIVEMRGNGTNQEIEDEFLDAALKWLNSADAKRYLNRDVYLLKLEKRTVFKQLYDLLQFPATNNILDKKAVKELYTFSGNQTIEGFGYGVVLKSILRWKRMKDNPDVAKKEFAIAFGIENEDVCFSLSEISKSEKPKVIFGINDDFVYHVKKQLGYLATTESGTVGNSELYNTVLDCLDKVKIKNVGEHYYISPTQAKVFEIINYLCSEKEKCQNGIISSKIFTDIYLNKLNEIKELI